MHNETKRRVGTKLFKVQIERNFHPNVFLLFCKISAFIFIIFSPSIMWANVEKKTPCIAEAKTLADFYINSPLYKSWKSKLNFSLPETTIQKLSALLGRDLTSDELTKSNRITQVTWNYLENHSHIQKAFTKAFAVYPCQDIHESLTFIKSSDGQEYLKNTEASEQSYLQDAPSPLKEAEMAFFHYLRNISRPFKIPSGAMLPTLHPGDHIFVDLKAYEDQDPKRGDIIVFPYPNDESKIFIKRIIGLPGDILQIINKGIFLNDLEFADKTFTQRIDPGIINDIFNPRDNFGPVLMPENSYFVLGDNRDQSLDSRFWGFLKREKILGKATLIYFSIDEAKKNGHSKTIIWERIGTELR